LHLRRVKTTTNKQQKQTVIALHILNSFTQLLHTCTLFTNNRKKAKQATAIGLREPSQELILESTQNRVSRPRPTSQRERERERESRPARLLGGGGVGDGEGLVEDGERLLELLLVDRQRGVGQQQVAERHGKDAILAEARDELADSGVDGAAVDRHRLLRLAVLDQLEAAEEADGARVANRLVLGLELGVQLLHHGRHRARVLDDLLLLEHLRSQDRHKENSTERLCL